MSSHDVGSGNVVKQIFQEIYLGRNLFETTYGLPAKTRIQEGLITPGKASDRTRRLPDADTENLLAIATGRPAAEAGICPGSF